MKNHQQPTPITKDPLQSEQPRKERSDKGQPRITFRDRDLLKFIGEQYVIRLDQLITLVAQYGEPRAENTVRNLADRWKEAGWVTTKKIYADQPIFIWLTKEGLQIAELEFRLTTPSPNMLRHYTAVNNIRLKLKAGKWRSERYLWADLTDEEKRNRKHIADAEVTTPTGQIQAIEVELTAKHSERIRKIVDTLLDKYALVYYFCTPESQVAVNKAVSELRVGEREKIKVLNL